MASWRALLVTTALFTAALAVQAQEGTTGISMVENSAVNPNASKWGVSFYNLSSAPMAQLGDSPSVFAYNYLALNYKFNKTQRVSFRPVFQLTTEGKDKWGNDVKSDTVLGDAHFVYADYEIATLGAANVSTSFKFYLPTSEGSQSNGMLLKFRPETFISWGVGRYDSVTYAMKPDFFVQSRASNFDSRGREFTTNVFVLEHYLEYGWSLNKTFKVKPAAGFIDSWSNPSENPRVNFRRTEAKLALGLDVYAMKGLSFTVSAENRFSVADRRDDVAIMRPEENSVVLITNASL